jgi:RNA polymerase sigma factor (sigma-70 family)
VATTTSRTPAQGDTNLPSFVEAVEAHKAMVYSIAWHFLRDRAVAEELAQDVFLELHRNWSSIKSAQHIVFWLRKVTSRRSIDVLRQRRTRGESRLRSSESMIPCFPRILSGSSPPFPKSSVL